MAATIPSCLSLLPTVHHRGGFPNAALTTNTLQRPRRSRRYVVVASASATDRAGPVIVDLGRGSDQAAKPSGHSDDGELAAQWREIHGSNNWEGLLDPLDAVPRGELIRYGEFAQATYDSFDYDRFSPYCGSCKYRARTLFHDMRGGYSVAARTAARQLGGADSACQSASMACMLRVTCVGSRLLC